MADMELYLGDCLEIMPKLARVDWIITDPPYGIGESNRRNLSRHRNGVSINYVGSDFDNERLSAEYFNAMMAVSNNQIIFGGNYYTDYLKPVPSWVVWDKLNSGDFADCEMAWCSNGGAAKMFRYMWNGMIKQKPEKRYHLTQKPLDLMLWIVRTYTKLGQVILDPFMGSGTTGVACKLLHRRFVGIEKDAHYFDIAAKRIAETQAPAITEEGVFVQPEQAPLFEVA